jgi:hypothetical protein
MKCSAIMFLVGFEDVRTSAKDLKAFEHKVNMKTKLGFVRYIALVDRICKPSCSL